MDMVAAKTSCKDTILKCDYHNQSYTLDYFSKYQRKFTCVFLDATKQTKTNFRTTRAFTENIAYAGIEGKAVEIDPNIIRNTIPGVKMEYIMMKVLYGM